MTKAILINVGTAIRPLGDTQPRQRGAGGIEAISSYIAAQALRHSCSPYTLFSSVLIPSDERLNVRWRRVRWGESHLINSYGDVAFAVAGSIECAAGIEGALRMTLRGLELICDPKAKHLMHPTRPWCPECYREARDRRLPAWDALYTYVRTTRVCVWHRSNLRFCCEQCRLGQRYLPRFPFLDYCEHCGADLATQRVDPAIRGSSTEEATGWIARAALDMIDSLGRGHNLATQHFARNVQGLMNRHFGGKETPFAARLGLAASSPKNWLKRGSAPTWSSLVDLGYRLDIPPAQLCSPEPALTDPQYWRKLPSAVLDKPHVRPSAELLARVKCELSSRLGLQGIIPGAQLEGLPRLAKRLQVSLGVLKRNFPEECSLLVAQRVEIRRTSREAALRERDQRMSEAVVAVAEQGLPITGRNLKRTGRLKVSDVIGRPPSSQQL